MNDTQLVEMNESDLVKADWNYKTDGTEEQIEKLMASIGVDKSVGVLAVREKGKKFEVIDGNHRLEAIKRLGWKKVPCENFGDISKAKAITIARRRNHKWFEDDVLAYAKLFKEDVLSEFKIDELVEFMPETEQEMEELKNLDEFDWGEYDGDSSYEEDDLKTIKVTVPEETYNLWLEWKEKCSKLSGYDTDSKAFEFAIAEALNTPESE
mgnify:CR=1 FL=1|tara:strand:- start:11362 stop:11991 length:630 start_codon:yes stop_codon:yes gene_type:complete